ncbi:MAG: hypothetical protein JSW72_07485 [Candidatus Bathyarchaeota archaeon]|nr:MAG: hypothetical protein JSW72_07485 [Candidatus Bathyarchaeota archaeon]
MQSKTRIYHFKKDDIYRKNISILCKREREMKDLDVIIAKYYFPDELFVGQVEEVVNLLAEGLSKLYSPDQAVNKANQIVAKYYLSAEA